MEKELKHFSHGQHPLSLLLGSQQKDETVQNSTCYGCQNPVLLEPTYTCKECSIFLHKKCAELPREINYPMHNDHPLVLLAEPPYKNEICLCEACRKCWSNFTYHCSSCNFDIDILCAFQDRKFEHPSHKHALTLVQRPAFFECNACEEKLEDESYLCTTCPFWIHKNCGLLPKMNQRKDHDHPLFLAYCLPTEYRGYGFSCEICNEELRPSSWVYYCGPCRYLVHIRCITKETREPGEDPAGVYLHLPSKNLEGIMRYYLESGQSRPEIMMESHKHALVLSHVQKDCITKQEDIICDGCIDPIESSYYKCGQCSFFLHVTCTRLPLNFQYLYHHADAGPEHKSKLFFPENTWEAIKCNTCNLNCSGYSHKCEACDFSVDIKYLYLRGTIKHKAHPHSLFPTRGTVTDKCNGCGVSNLVHSFACFVCKFYLGNECAMLPPTVRHRWDKHELILSFPPFTDVIDKFYCEICEEEIHPKRWAYRCVECDQSFHPQCIPTLGISRNIKFGRSLEVSTHPHQLTLIPDGRFQSCNSCGKSLQWQKVFECEPCKFYLCPECIPKNR